MVRHPDEFITVPEPPEAITGIRRLDLLMRIGVANAALDLVLRFGAVSAVLAVAIVSVGPSSFAGSGSTCFPAITPTMAAEVSAALAELAVIQAQEEALRRRLAGPGLIIPKNLEVYR